MSEEKSKHISKLKVGDKAVLDKEFRNSSIVTIISFTPKKLYATVRSEEGIEWETMSYRLTEVEE